VDPKPVSHYARLVRPDLPDNAFEPEPTRLLWLLAHITLIVLGTTAIVMGLGGWPGTIVASLVIGHSFAGCSFVGHELLHGAVVRQRTLRYVIGWICFLPFTMAPRLWIAWHNRVHHGNTMIDGVDPDAYPMMAAYRSNRLVRIADMFSLAYRRWAGFVTLLIGFTGQSQQMLWKIAKPAGYVTRREHTLAVLETLLGYAFWASLGILFGGRVFLFAFVLPLLIGNAIVIGYILTNHSLSPLGDINDPLLNSLSVTVPRVVDALHLNFGFHVEHHLFPAMSARHAPLVRDSLVRRWPERYQTMPLLRALRLLMITPRVYGSPTTLTDPYTGYSFPTLQPGVRAVAPAVVVDEAPLVSSARIAIDSR
jgi:fatty acid desaturase